MSVARDQLLCLPEPLTPAKGFSWSRHTKLCLAAHFFMISMTSWLLSQAVLASVYTGAISVLTGATSVVFGLGQDAQPPELFVQVLHKGRNTGADGAVIVVAHFLALGRRSAPNSVRPVSRRSSR